MLSFTNNSGPLFIVGTVGISLFGSSLIGFLLFFTHILGCLTVGILFRFWKKNSYESVIYNTSKTENKLQNITFLNLGEVLSKSIQSSISTILLIGGFIVLFSVIISILNASRIVYIVDIIFKPICNMLNVPTQISGAVFTGIIEVTNGISLISKIRIKQISVNIIVSAFLLGFGGISILLQVLSIVSKSDLSIKPYVIGKLLHGLFSAFYTFLLIQAIPLFNLNL